MPPARSPSTPRPDRHPHGALLGGLSADAFLRRHWQKHPLLIRQAIPGFAGLCDRDAICALAARPEVTSRLVIDHGGGRRRWARQDGPLDLRDLLRNKGRARDRWTVLVHGIESLVPGAWELLRRFSFVPAARIDDLMVSYATDGGSVGPHDDRYDVFLLQGPGRRRWRIARGGDRTVDPGAGIKVLARFSAEQEWVLEQGDMLYLPPGVAHHGIAEGPCFTYSIGFLAPSATELTQGFLGYLGGVLPTDERALYSDPGLRVPRDPFALPDTMVDHAVEILDHIRWDRRLVEDFLGCFLTRPRPGQRFTPPPRPLSPEAFARRLRRTTLRLALPSRGLWRDGRLFFNGVTYGVRGAAARPLRELVAMRALAPPRLLDRRALELLHAWYRAGYVEP